MMDYSNLPEIQIEEEEDGTLNIYWDDQDPRVIAAGINDWSEQDWIDALEETAQRLKVTEDTPDQDGVH